MKTTTLDKLSKFMILILTEIFLDRYKSKHKVGYITLCDFQAVVNDMLPKCDTLFKFYTAVDLFGYTDDIEFSNIIFQYTSFVRKFMKRVENF